MLWKAAYEQLCEQLGALYSVTEARLIARWTAEHTSGQDYRQLETQSLTAAQAAQWQQYSAALLQQQPVQYVLGTAWFYNLPFAVNKAVLIPRPETEELVELVLKHQSNAAGRKTALQVLDIGTGSGCIAITLAKNLQGAVVTAVDESAAALEVARLNAQTHQVQVQWKQLNFLDEAARSQLPMFDVIVSNPPYICTSEATRMPAQVVAFEPHLALFVPDDDALLFYRHIAAFARQQLQAGGQLFVEINQQLGMETAALFREAGLQEVSLLKDISGNDRFVKAVQVT